MAGSIILSIIASTLSIIAICRTCDRTLGVDYIGAIVGVLGATVTVLVGWQIYTLVDMRQYKENIDVLRRDMQSEKQTQRRALREFAAETRLLEAGRIIGSFDEKKGNHAVVGIGYCSLIQALKLLIGARNEFIDEVLGLMKKCIYLAKLHNAWDKMFPQEIEEASKSEYYFITSGLLGVSDYVSQIETIRTWRQNRTMDDAVFKKIQNELLSAASKTPSNPSDSASATSNTTIDKKMNKKRRKKS